MAKLRPGSTIGDVEIENKRGSQQRAEQAMKNARDYADTAISQRKHARIRRPIVTKPENESTYPRNVKLQARPYSPLFASEYRVHRQFQVIEYTSNDNSGKWDHTLVDKTTDSDELEVELEPGEKYTWRCRDVSEVGNESDWSEEKDFYTYETYTLKPEILSPVDGEENVNTYLSIEISEGELSEGEFELDFLELELLDEDENHIETIESSDYEFFLDNRVSVDQSYKLRARVFDKTFGPSPWSDTVSFSTSERIGSVFAVTGENRVKRLNSRVLSTDAKSDEFADNIGMIAHARDDYLAMLYNSNEVKLVDPNDFSAIHLWENEFLGSVEGIFSLGNYFLIYTSEDYFYLLDTQTFDVIESASQRSINDLFAADGMIYLAAQHSAHGGLSVFDAQTLDELDSTTEFGSVKSVILTAEDEVVIFDNTNTIRRLDRDSLEQIGTSYQHPYGVYETNNRVVGIEPTPDNQFYFIDDRGVINLFDLDAMDVILSCEEQELNYSGDFRRLSLGCDGYLYLLEGENRIVVIDPSDFSICQVRTFAKTINEITYSQPRSVCRYV